MWTGIQTPRKLLRLHYGNFFQNIKTNHSNTPKTQEPSMFIKDIQTRLNTTFRFKLCSFFHDMLDKGLDFTNCSFLPQLPLFQPIPSLNPLNKQVLACSVGKLYCYYTRSPYRRNSVLHREDEAAAPPARQGSVQSLSHSFWSCLFSHRPLT